MITSNLEGAIYVIHAKKGYEFQEKRIISLFDELGLSYEFITDGDPSLFTEELLSDHFIPGIQNKFSQGGISCTLNHMLALRRMIEKKEPFALILENDPFFLGDFKQGLERLVPEIKSLTPGFIISLENTTLTFPSFWQTRRNKHLYRALASRMAGAYLVDLQGAKEMVKNLESHKCADIIDWWINRLIDRKIIKMYWAHPAIVEQGSHNGKLYGTISRKKKTLRRRISWLVQKAYKLYVLRLFRGSKLIIPEN